MSILLLILLGVALWFTGKAIWRGFGFYRQMKDIYNAVNPQESRTRGGNSRKSSSRKRDVRPRGRIIPPEYAVDVEYVEVKTYSDENTTIHTTTRTVYREEQVSDAEWEDIK